MGLFNTIKNFFALRGARRLVQDNPLLRGGLIRSQKLLKLIVPAYRKQIGIEVIKDLGNAKMVCDRYSLDKVVGTHAIGHARMATE